MVMIQRTWTPFLARLHVVVVALALLPGVLPSLRAAAGPAPVDFGTQIRPILSGKCFKCHGPDSSGRKADLRLDLRAEAIREHDGGQAIAPGNPAASGVIQRLRTSDLDDVMPPPKEGAALTESEIALIERWIGEGSPYATHWAFVRPERPARPAVSEPLWCRTAVDAFALARLEREGLKPSPRADRHTLIRRLSLDLTGLPPSPDETSRFLDDSNPGAYERLVERLLASPAFGERWARVWLDLGRYADSAGYGSDPLRLNIWPWRDWVISALNANEGFDRFTIEQLAGDLLPNPSRDQLIATAFHRNTMTNTEGGTDDEEFRVAAVKDRANTTSQVWMGLTMGCAQCHSHKYDPITQREYYEFYSFFNQTEDTDQPDERPTLPLPTPEQQLRIESLTAEIEGLEKRRKTVTPEFEKDLAGWEKTLADGIQWATLEPERVKSYGGADLEVLEDGSILATGDSPETDTYEIRMRTESTNVTAVRLELLPHESLAGNGPGRADSGGQVVVSELKLAVRGRDEALPKVRFVRIELPGEQRVLSLAEVQVLSDGVNHSLLGRSTQSSTAEGAGAARGMDGDENGDFDGGSVTLTGTEDNPWWELDLLDELSVDEIVVWNRTDRGFGTRLAGFKVRALDANREKVWERSVSTPPAPFAFLRLPSEREVKLDNASAAFSAKGFGVGEAIDGNEGANSGWSVGAETGTAHAAAFEVRDEKLFKTTGSLLIVTLSQNGGTNQTVGRFRLSVTDQSGPVRIPPRNIAKVLGIASGERSETEREELNAYFRDFAPSLADLNEELRDLRKKRDRINPVAVPVLRELADDKARESHILAKGNFLLPGDEVTPAVPAAFHPLPEGSPTNRLGLARWVMSPENPLTARVAVNRLWAQLFGTGIVETEEDFGTQGTLPTHPELLDWLAVEFQENGWNVKAMIKTIVLSATYQQASATTPERLEKDPLNRLFSRGPRRRLDAEAVRDQALALGGILSRKMGGESVYPAQPDGLWRAAFNGQRTWATSKGEDRYRRGLYTFWRRTVPYPSMATFDAPSRENCVVRRIPTNTPLQAFVTMNDPVFVEAAQALARRILRECAGNDEDRVRFGLNLCLVRAPTREQVVPVLELLKAEREVYRDRSEDAVKLATEPRGPLPVGLDVVDAAAWTVVASVLLNLDGVLSNN